MTLKDLLSVSATATTIGQFLSGMLTVMKVWRKGGPGDISPVPFLAGTVGCSLWLYYGIVIEDITVAYTNVIGTALNAFYVLCFLLLAAKKLSLLRQVVSALIFIGLVILYVQSLEEQELQKSSLGLICVIVSLLSCASPLIVLWWFYGVLISDFYMQVTNFLGTLIALLQLSLFVIYPTQSGKKRTPTQVFYAPLKTDQR